MLEAPDLDKLCEIFDPHRNGYIVIEDFIRISKEFLPEQKVAHPNTKAFLKKNSLFLI